MLKGGIVLIDETNMDIVYIYMDLVKLIEEMRREKDMNTTEEIKLKKQSK